MDRIGSQIIFVALCVVPGIVVWFYPTGDWVTGPLLVIYVFPLLILIQCFAAAGLLLLKRGKSRLVALEVGIAVISWGLMLQYLVAHS